MSEYIKNLKKPVAIIGMGKSGSAAKKLLVAAGLAETEIFTFDSQKKEAQFQDPTRLLAQAAPQTLVISPGVPLSLPWLQMARQNGLHLTSELNLAASTLTTENLIGVTGSVGKSTTVSILGAGLAAFSANSFVGGNLGTPFAEYATEVLEKKRPRAEWVVLELSSYQLENCSLLKLDLAAITFFTANHLERYESLLAYYETKWKVAQLTRGEIILNPNGGDLQDFFQGKNAGKILWADRKLPELQVHHLEEASLIGDHNQDNLAVAALLALRAEWPLTSIEAMKKFSGLQHRLENLGEIRNIRFINDSKATAMESVLIAVQAAISSQKKDGHLYVLLGGKDKNLPWEQLQTLTKFPRIIFVFFGECRQIAHDKSTLAGTLHEKLKEAFDFCLVHCKEGDTILLSPWRHKFGRI